jgi:hypothetical protein
MGPPAVMGPSTIMVPPTVMELPAVMGKYRIIKRRNEFAGLTGSLSLAELSENGINRIMNRSRNDRKISTDFY